MDVILKADIVEDVSDNLQLNLDSDSDILDRFINKVLSDMSKRGLLIGTDATQTLIDGSTTLDWPTGYRSVINITLTNTTSGVNRQPLIKLPGGHKEYRQNIASNSTGGVPNWFSEFDGKFYLWGQAEQAYTTLIEYRKNHAKDPDNIEFTTDFENLMLAGTTFWKAAQLGRPTAITLWKPLYDMEMKKAVLDRKSQPSIMRG